MRNKKQNGFCRVLGLVVVGSLLAVTAVCSVANAEEAASGNVVSSNAVSQTSYCGSCPGCCTNIEVGKRAPVIDGVGWVLGIPRKILLWDRRADNHDVSATTVGEVAQYIDDRGLQDVKVRVNQYDPGGEWRRLVANKRVGAGWRYTIGTLSTLGYTLLPGRLFGHDHYNPYTNTLSVYSDAPALSLAEAAYAKDIHERELPGTYATAQSLPLVAIWHESLATEEVLDYVSTHGSKDEQEQVRRQLYARYGMELGGAVGGVMPDGSSLFPVVGAAGGHVAATVEDFAKPGSATNR